MSPLDRFRDVDDALEAGATLEELSAHTSPIEQSIAEPKPAIRLGAEFHTAVSESIAALRSDPNLFQRAGKLVTVVHEEETEAEVDGRPFILKLARVREISHAGLRVSLSNVATFEKYTEKYGWRAVAPPKDVAEAVMGVGEWPGIPPLTSIIETPLMRPDGTIVNMPGYDAATGTFYAPQCEYGAVPERPTQEDARAALQQLLTPFSDFPVTTEAARMVPVADILTLIARQAIDGAVPGTYYDASTRGSGKTLLAQTVSRLALGHEVGVTTWSNKPEEVEKVLGGVAAKGSPVVLFDNVNGLFGGAAIDKALTATDKVSFRTLGKTEQNEVRWRTKVLATGNNAQVAEDTSRRVLLCRLEPNCENPELRPDSAYKIPSLPSWSKKKHPCIVVAGLKLLSAYIVAGRPPQGLVLGSFQPWADLIASAIVWAGGANVVDCIHAASGDEDETLANKRVLVSLLGTLVRVPMSAKGIGDALWPPDFFTRPPHDGYDELRAAFEFLTDTKSGTKPDHKQLGIVLRSVKGRFFDGKCVEGKSEHKKPAKWSVKSQVSP
jgi:hypothetical protein